MAWRAAAILFLLLAAGCVRGPADAPDAPQGPAALAGFMECPRDVNGTLVPCRPSKEAPVVRGEVMDEVPPGWLCVQHADLGDTQAAVLKVYVRLSGSAGEAGAHEVGLGYDVRGSDASVAGAFQVASETGSPIFTWEGPARAFVRFPLRFTDLDMLYQGVLLPAELQYEATGFEARGAGLHFSRTPAGEDEWSAWNTTFHLHGAQATYHFLLETRFPFVAAPLHDRPGYAGYGEHGSIPRKVDVEGDGFSVHYDFQAHAVFTGYVLARTHPTAMTLTSLECGLDR